MADNSPTDNGGTDTGADTTALPENQTNNTAEEQHDTVSGDQSQGTVDNQDDQQSKTSTGDNGKSSNADDEALTKFAKSQGIEDLSELSDRELKLLKTARDNQKAFRERDQKKGADDMRKVEDQIYKTPVDEDADEYDKREADRDYRLNLLTAQQRKRDFFDETPDAKDYEQDMAQYIADEAERNGVDAARYLASDLRRVYVLVKDSKGGDEVRTASEAARREERELLRQKQEAGGDSAAANSGSRGKSSKIDRDWISNEYDPSNAEHRKMLDEALTRGDLY